MRTQRWAAGLVAAVLCVGCGGGEHGDGAPESDTSDAAPDPAADDSLPIAADSATPSELLAAADNVVRFLRGELPFAQLRLADSVVFRLPPDAGNSRHVHLRDELAETSAWTIVTDSRREHTLVPPPGLTEVTFKPGKHLNCTERPLSSVAPEMAEMPHVGVMLSLPEASSCLQSWTATFVFTPSSDPPELNAVVYDQWEW